MANWTLAEIREELYSFGHRYLEQEPGRADGFISRTVEQILRNHEWPFREVEESVTWGSAHAGLGKIIQIFNDDGTVAPLAPETQEYLRDEYKDLTTEGTARFYYLDGQNTLRCYPVDTSNSYTVRHYCTYGWIDNTDGTTRLQLPASGLDYTVIPFEWREVILTGARQMAKEDAGNIEDAVLLEGKFDEQVERMRAALINQQVDEYPRVRLTNEFA